MSAKPLVLLVIFELIWAVLVAAWGAFAVWRGIFYESWGEHPIYALLEGWMCLMAAAAFTIAARSLRGERRCRWLLHVVALSAGFLFLYAVVEWPIRLFRMQTVTFCAALGLSCATVVSVGEIAARGLRRGIALLGRTLIGVALLAATVWGAAWYEARRTADGLLMIGAQAYLSDAFLALERAVAAGALVGLPLGGLLIWVQRRANNDHRVLGG